MKRHTPTLVALTLSAGLAMGTAPAHAAETAQFRVAGNSLIATWLTVFDSCNVATTTLRLASSVIQTTGKPQKIPAVIVDVEYQYVCGPGGTDNPERLTLNGSAESATWQIRGDLGTGSLSGTVIVSDGADISLPVTFNVAFTATGPLATVHDTFNSNEGGVVITSRFRVSNRPADATGSVMATIPLSIGDVTVNLTGGFPSFVASIGTDTFGQITVIKK